jgi:hypothetical protein
MAGIPPPDNEELQLGQAPKVHCLGDEAWVTQQRVFEEVPEIQPERIQVADFLVESETKSSVIVPNAQQYNKFQWNEFPEEAQYDRETVPRVRAQDWVPQNDTEHIVHKTNFQSSRINRAWPPYSEEKELEPGQASRVKAQSDEAWIQQGATIEGEENDAPGNAVWKSQIGKGLKDTWNPSESGYIKFANEIGGSKLGVVQWPPPEFEERSQNDVQILQTNFAPAKHNRQWPPPGQGPEETGEEPVQQYA